MSDWYRKQEQTHEPCKSIVVMVRPVTDAGWETTGVSQKKKLDLNTKKTINLLNWLKNWDFHFQWKI